MAESVILALFRPAFETLGSDMVKESGLVWGVNEDLEQLSSLLTAIQAVIGDAEEKQVQSRQVRDWLTKLKDILYDVDDVLDEFATESLRLKIQTSKWKQILDFFSSSNPIVLRFQIAHKVKEVMKRLDNISKEKNNLHLHSFPEGDGGSRPGRERSETISFIKESSVFGREKEKEKLINLLMSDGSSESDVSVIPIVGMGGLGKTTLAQLIYNDESVSKQFHIRAWICVSEDFNLKRLVKEIITSAFKETPNFDHLSTLVEHLQAKLVGMKFLLVLDDMWSEDPNDWDALKDPLSCGAKGSKIIVTTRSEKVSRIMGTIPSFQLGILSDEYCLELFRKRAFANESCDKHRNLDAIGVNIVKKCKGVPLAAKTLGGLLLFKREEKEWNDILESEIWELPQEKKDILPILRLSYHHLPSHLKQCFEYCSLFPKDFEFDKEKLVKMWMGEGFIRSEGEGGMEMEDIGRGYFDDLLWRSFFQYEGIDRYYYGPRYAYKMHDMIHDVAQSVSEGLCFRMEVERPFHFSEKARYSSLLYTKGDQTIPESFYKSKSLRTFVMLYQSPRTATFINHNIFPNHNTFFQGFRCFRVLDLSGTKIKELPDSIGDLKHLRYLDLSRTLMERVPDSVCNLYNLQTLDVTGNPCELPKDMRNLISLRHLVFDKNSRVRWMPQGIGKLTRLQTLSNFIVGKEKSRGGEIGELKKLNNLRGEVCISLLENVVNAKDAELKSKQYIERLELKWGRRYGRDVKVVDEEETLESLQPNCSNLKELSIWGYCGESFPSWMSDPSFSKLVDIELGDCISCKILPPLGQLPFLRKLTIQGLEKVASLPSGLQNLIYLEELYIVNLPQLTSLPEGFQNLTSLRSLTLRDCPKIATIPEEGLPTRLQTLTIRECPLLHNRCQKGSGQDWSKISHIPSIYIDHKRISST